jgi:uncharacterized protein (DUF2236 family)
LGGTLRSYLAIVYGTGTTARSEIRRLNALHRTITGPTYRARDPDLAMWVHATLVDSTIVAADAWLKPVSRARRERYYAETVPIGRAFGIPAEALPPDLDAFEAYLDRMFAPAGPILVGALARELADVVLHPPLGPIVPALAALPAVAYSWTLWPAVGLLPPSVRDAYGLHWGRFEQAVSAWLVAGWRAWRPWLPSDFRQMPQALAADRRLAIAPTTRSAPPARDATRPR